MDVVHALKGEGRGPRSEVQVIKDPDTPPEVSSDRPKSFESINVASINAVNKKWATLLERADVNKDGVIDVAEVIAVIESMLKERSMKRVFRFVSIGLFIVVLVLIAALSGITYGIVQLAKDTKVTSYSNSTYQFMMTKDGKAAVMGGAALDLSSLTVHADGPSRRSLLAPTGAGGRLRRLLEGDANTSSWAYFGTISYDTVARGCGMLEQNVQEFPVATPRSSIFLNGTTLDVVKIVQHTGCNNNGDVHNVSAYIETAGDGYGFYVHCDESIGGCDLWAYVTVVTVDGNSTSTARRRLVQKPRVTPLPVAALSHSADSSTESAGFRRHLQQAVSKGKVYPSRAIADDPPDSSDDLADVGDLTSAFCFPAGASVEVLGRGVVRMAELQYGDLVRSVDRSSRAVVFRPVFLFGHREEGGSLPYVHLTAAGRTLAATRGHFVPVCVAGCTAWELGAGAAVMENRRAGDIRVGDVVVVATPSPAFATVTLVEILFARGAYNPYVRGADIVVDDVLASPHSDWLLDSIAPAWMVPHLPAIYEALLAPVYGLYCMVGPTTAEWLAHGLRLAETGATDETFFLGYWAVLAGMAAPVVGAALLGHAASKRLAVARRA